MQTELGGSNYLPDLELENFTQLLPRKELLYGVTSMLLKLEIFLNQSSADAVSSALDVSY